MTDTSYHMAIGIDIGKFFSSVLDIKSIREKWYQSIENIATYEYAAYSSQLRI